MDVRFLTLNSPDLFIVLRTIVKNARLLPESIQVAPFDDHLLVENGVWLRGPDMDVFKAVKIIDKKLKSLSTPIRYVWSPEPTAHPASATEALQWFERRVLNETHEGAIKAWDTRGRKTSMSTGQPKFGDGVPIDAINDSTVMKDIGASPNNQARFRPVGERLANDPEAVEIMKATKIDENGQVFDPESWQNKDWKNLTPEQQHEFFVNWGQEIAWNRSETWSATSGDSDPQAIAMQKAAEREFKLYKTSSDHFPDKPWRDADYIDQQQGPMNQKILRAMYDETQDYYKKLGITEISVNRGIHFTSDHTFGPSQKIWADQKQGESVDAVFRSQPMSSFTVEAMEGRNWAQNGTHGYLLSAKIPVENILSTNRTGFGTRWEFEVVVLGHPMKMRVKRMTDTSPQDPIRFNERAITYTAWMESLTPYNIDEEEANADWLKPGKPGSSNEDHEGALKAWDTRGRGRKKDDTTQGSTDEHQFTSTKIAKQNIAQVIGKSPMNVYINNSDPSLRAAVRVHDVLSQMKDQGYKMPENVQVTNRSGGLHGETTDYGMEIVVPDTIPKTETLDDATRAVFGKSDDYGIKSFDDVVIHEMGHVQAGVRAKKEFSSGADREAAKKVSTYAGSNVNEFLAEAFTRLYHGDKLPTASMKLYKELNGPEIKH